MTVSRRAVLPICVGCAVLLVISIAVTVSIGPADISLREVYSVIGSHLGLGSSSAGRLADGIVWQLRLPRAVLAAGCGAGLALCGAILQSLLRNPLADPFVLGVSSGASAGAVSVAVLGVGAGALTLSGGAFAGAVLSFALMLALAYGAGGTPDRVILAGVACTQLFSALTSLIVLWSANAEQTRGVLFWLLGSLAGATWSDVTTCGIVFAIGCVICLWYAPTLDAFAFGPDAAAGLGVAVTRTRTVLLLITALVTAALVSAAGAIGFVGLVLPHAARFLVGPAHARLLPVTVLMGAVFMVWADTIARSAFGAREVPVGVVTALLGVPAFALLLARRRRLA
ncbi:iron chelate uptake ABC transporter family permease subunit [Nocardia sp. NBC_01503]|uniref:FecCD family ABC transporter permease n=1 Tax=Nocardia sp. NBC_01503 TaxID=2975997 RepID=UPI002E7B2775|nr:iron chelate uptake ABC transporter family permease subunit [Nocardia sp. NBC_01503]WTL33287.1 iron chelate uptake ABC transporter family permease subunit [Nocardia sp. NBC_01503]